MRPKTAQLLLAATAVVLASGCDVIVSAAGGVRGSGNVVSEQRTVPAFSQIEIKGSADADVTVGVEQSVTVSADDNILPSVTTEVEGDRLVVSTKGRFTSHGPIQLKVSVPALESVGVAGSGDVRARGVSGNTFSVAVAGSGSVTAQGKVDRVYVSISGSGDAHLFDLVARSANVNIAGSGDARVHATEELTGSVAGSGDIGYRGNPETVRRSVSGSGDIRSAP